MKPDDCTLSPQRLAKVQAEAKRALLESGAQGVFPTPVEAIMKVADVHEVKEDVLNDDSGFLQKIRRELGASENVLKRALGKVLGLFDARASLVFIDRSLMPVKQTFVRLHEAAHGFLPWQRPMYSVVEDSKESLEPSVADAFDREANVFAAEVLFQCDSFAEEAADHNSSIWTPIKLSKKYGASIYSAIRQYVSKNSNACVVLVLEPPVLTPGAGFVANSRRVIHSSEFGTRFGSVIWPSSYTPDDQFGRLIPVGKARSSGRQSISLKDDNGDMHEFMCEAFTNTYQVFVLLHHKADLSKKKVYFMA